MSVFHTKLQIEVTDEYGGKLVETIPGPDYTGDIKDASEVMEMFKGSMSFKKGSLVEARVGPKF